MTVSITFLGASGTVTGSKYLVEINEPNKNYKILVDAGLFQGSREWREKNWEDIPAALLSEIDACLITHAHIDHTGILPRLVRNGLKCPVYATAPSVDLSRLLLLDSAFLQEEEARFREKENCSRHHPPLPLYTKEDAIKANSYFKPVPFNSPFTIVPGVSATWSHMGHILGAAAIRLVIGDKAICFSGDIGRYGVPILKDPESIAFGDLLLIESTYGDKDHKDSDPIPELQRIVTESVSRRGVLLIPSFAVGRTQSLLYYLRELKEKSQIPDIPIIVDSPMADDATALYSKYPSDYDEAALQILSRGKRPFQTTKLHFTKDRQESVALNNVDDPMIIISASGMLSGGRILHHLKHRISDPRNTLLFVGYQPPGGRGDWIKQGNPWVRLFGRDTPVRAHIEEMTELSAHAGKSELLRWCKSGSGTPGKVMVVHGEPETAKVFRDTLETTLGWNAQVAKYRETISL